MNCLSFHQTGRLALLSLFLTLLSMQWSVHGLVQLSSRPSAGSKLTMDTEAPNTRDLKLVKRWKMSSAFLGQKQHAWQRQTKKDEPSAAISQQRNSEGIQEKYLHGMPWRTSIDPRYSNAFDSDNGLYYMPFWEHQLQFMKENLTNLRVLPVRSQVTGADLSYVENTSNKAAAVDDSRPKQQPMRMHTLQFASDEFRLIRMTVMDAGAQTQVFTSVWYPDPDKFSDMPILGVDLLQFGQRKHLCIMDFQPVHDDKHETTPPVECESLMAPIREQYPALQGRMSPRFYDESSFFSQQMLLGREDSNPDVANEMVYHNFMPAFQSYLKTYADLHRSHAPTAPLSVEQREANLQRQVAYDTYSAERDPAHALLTRCFGAEFADDPFSESTQQ